jgi:hypothetical protein
MKRLPLVLSLMALLLSGCAAINQLSVQVSTFGTWPEGRAPGRYAFERLPSQQQPAQADQQQLLEAAAAAALAKAGFVPAADTASADVLVQVGARQQRADPSPWDDPHGWYGALGVGRIGPWRGGRWHLGLNFPLHGSRSLEREVAVLLRDRAGGQPLFEARATSEGYSGLASDVAGAMFQAALADFPRPGLNPRTVAVPLNP